MKRILIVNLGGLGDVLLSMPAIVALRKKYPTAQIDFLGARKSSAIAEKLEALNSKIYLDIRYKGSSFLSILRNFKTLFNLRFSNYDVALNMRTIHSRQSAKKIYFFLSFIGAKENIGRNTENWASFFDKSIFEPKIGKQHELFYDFETVRLLGAEPQLEWMLAISKESINKVKKIKEDLAGNKKLILWHVGGMPSRRLPHELLKAIVSAVLIDDSFKILFCGSDEELAQIEDYDGTLKLRSLSFDDLSAFISIADLFVSNDTGPMHIGAVLQKKAISFFGPGDFKRYDPRVINKNAIVFRGGANCAPCEKQICKSRICFDSIDKNKVINSIIGQES